MKILVVDDHAMLANSLSAFLSDEGHDPEIAANGEEALGLVAFKEYHLILVDYKMPRMTGLEVIKRLRKAKFPGYVVLMSVHEPCTISSNLRGDGVDMFLAKPFTPEMLRATLSRFEEFSHAAPFTSSTSGCM